MYKIKKIIGHSQTIKHYLLAIGIASVTLFFSGCATFDPIERELAGLPPFTILPNVEPWEKEFLGDPIMQFASDKKSSIYEQHMLNSREASSGGYGGGGGGCGCK